MRSRGRIASPTAIAPTTPRCSWTRRPRAPPSRCSCPRRPSPTSRPLPRPTDDAAQVDVLLPEDPRRHGLQPARSLRPVTAEHWLEVCRAMRDAVVAAVAGVPRAQRADELGRGAGGDMTVAIDQAAEDAAFAVLAAVAEGGEGFTVVSEEVGERSFGGGGRWRVVIDPIDGSLNAKRGLPLYALSVAIADGPAMADVALGYVFDLGNGEEWIARRGGGATRRRRAARRRRGRSAGCSWCALEATRPEHLAPACAALPGEVERVRVLGSLALALCHLADGRVDAVASLRPNGARSIDIAAAQLAVREAGSAIALPDAPGSVRGGAARSRRALAGRRRPRRRRAWRAWRRCSASARRGRARRSRVACGRDESRLRRAPDRARAGHRPRDPAQRRRARHGRRASTSTAARARHDPPHDPGLPAQVEPRGAGADARRRRAGRRERRRSAFTHMDEAQRAALRAATAAAAGARASGRSPSTQRTRVIAVASGKGGVGKSSLTVNLALALRARGPRGRRRRRRHLRLLDPGHARHPAAARSSSTR